MSNREGGLDEQKDIRDRVSYYRGQGSGGSVFVSVSPKTERKGL